MDERRDSWHLGEGEPITEDLTAMRLLGGGEAYEAYLAFDEITFSPVVVKVLRPGQVEDSSAQRGLRREVAALARVNHPVVVRGLRHEHEGPRPHVVLEHIDGPRLSSLIRRYGPLQEAQYLPLAIDVASALHYLRHIGHVHLDIKPSNIIMGAPARLIDLSVARTIDAAAELGHPIGTDAYMAPEQCTPRDDVRPGPDSDVWGLGATLFEAVSGRLPFSRGDRRSPVPEETWPQLVEEPGALPERVPDELAKVVYAALERRPQDRPLPHEIAETLQPVLERQPRGHLAGFRVR
ncbi:serine/threonine protein kinase [Nocardioides sp. JQ2195]|uniref:serine/threonine-protein kinase n=1 Tax=Nocardioides sp. JQ2195 TaxID=2592334 RepID=UPI00143EC220|nr:serine/threonine-protein kinase [Nocardioides sp. JQ2195]QIX27302.1 serine/threonine protein kinase [Nocardioides sp. JQ2195]